MAAGSRGDGGQERSRIIGQILGGLSCVGVLEDGGREVGGARADTIRKHQPESSVRPITGEGEESHGRGICVCRCGGG